MAIFNFRSKFNNATLGRTYHVKSGRGNICMPSDEFWKSCQACEVRAGHIKKKKQFQFLYYNKVAAANVNTAHSISVANTARNKPVSYIIHR